MSITGIYLEIKNFKFLIRLFFTLLHLHKKYLNTNATLFVFRKRALTRTVIKYVTVLIVSDYAPSLMDTQNGERIISIVSAFVVICHCDKYLTVHRRDTSAFNLPTKHLFLVVETCLIDFVWKTFAKRRTHFISQPLKCFETTSLCNCFHDVFRRLALHI